MDPLKVVSPDSATAKQESVTQLFHRLNRVLPDEQIITTIAASTKVFDALRLMKSKSYSQLPVVEGNEVLGVFSFRSLAEGAVRLGKQKVELGDLPVDEFVEKS